MDVIDAIRRKRAVRAYSPELVSDDVICSILDAGRRAQSSQNTQPCRFIVVSEKEGLAALSQCGKYAAHLADAAFGIAIAHPAPSLNVSVLFDAGQSAAYMQLAALALDVVSCIVKLHQAKDAGELLCLPGEYEMHFVLAMGYPENPQIFQSFDHDRSAINEISFREVWGIPYSKK